MTLFNNSIDITHSIVLPKNKSIDIDEYLTNIDTFININTLVLGAFY